MEVIQSADGVETFGHPSALKLAIWGRVQCMKGLGLDVQSMRGGGGVPLKDNEESHCIVSVRGSSICGVAYTVERLLYAWDGL